MYKLRELERKDIEIINKWRNDPELISFLGAPYRYINSEVDFQWFEGYMKSRDNSVRCAVVNSEDDIIIGLVSLVSIDHLNQSAIFHIMIGAKENRGKGCGTFALNEILRHAFLNLNLNRIELDVLEDNERARHLYEKAGFVQEGIKRKARYKNGRFINLVIYSILKEEYMKKSAEITHGGGGHYLAAVILILLLHKFGHKKGC